MSNALKFQIRTNKRPDEKTIEEWLHLFSDATFDDKYAYFTIEAEHALKAINFIREKINASWSEISISRIEE